MQAILVPKFKKDQIFNTEIKTKMKTINLIFTVLFISIMANAQTINSEKSMVNFNISNMKLNTVDGTFMGMDGNVVFNENDLGNSIFDVSVPVNTVNTGNEKRDTHLKNADFFDVEKYPEIRFISTAITKTLKGYKTTGNLTLHGVTKPIEIMLVYQNKAFKGQFTINRFDYKLGENTNSFMVGKQTKIEIICSIE